MTDDLGNVRVITDVNGNIISRHDFLPFGEDAAPARTLPRQMASRWPIRLLSGLPAKNAIRNPD
jgi:hypothetical protein